MKTLGVLGALLAMGSASLTWIQAPITGDVGAGVGWAALAIGALGGAALLGRWARLALLCGAAGVALCGFTLVRLAVLDPGFWRLVDENEQYAGMMRFSFKHIPGNFGVEPTFEAGMATDGVLERLATALYFMGRGWWLAVLGLTLLGVGAGPRVVRQKWMAAAVAVLLAIPTPVLLGAMWGQYRRDQGDRAMAAGRYLEALDRYEGAQRFDPQLRGSEALHLRIGEALYHLGGRSHPAARFYLGGLRIQRGALDSGIVEYRLAVEGAPEALGVIVRRRTAWTLVEAGLAAYKERLVGVAAGWWERALTAAPDHLQAVFLLSRAHFDQGRYDESIAASHTVLRRSRRRLLNAQVQANIGDAYWKLADFGKARTAYAASLALDSYANYRMLRSLGGT